MSKGSKIVPVRIPADLLSEIEKAIESVNDRTANEPYTVGAWIRKAIDEKLSHLRRSSKRVEARKEEGKKSGLEGEVQ